MIRNQIALGPVPVGLALGTLLCLAPSTADPDSDRQAPSAPTLTAAAAAASPPVDPDWWNTALAEIQRSEYRVSSTPRGLQAPNRAQNLRTFFADGAIEVQPRTDTGEATPWRFGWRTTAWGRGGGMQATGPAAPEADGPRVTYAGAHLSEWYENREEGLEQGFTVHERAPGHGPLRIEGRVDGGLRAELLPDGTIDFLDANDVRALNYGELHVWDADGTELTSWLEVDSNVVAIAVNDEAARYPLTIDPLLTSPAWTAAGGQTSALFGSRLATAGDVNGDGYSDVIVGASGYDGGAIDQGRADVFLGSASGLAFTAAWTVSGSYAQGFFGSGVASAGDVNGDGFDDVVVGASRYPLPVDAGAAFVFHGSASGLGATAAWTYQSGQALAYLGFDVDGAGDVNGDGFDDIIVGALLHDAATGDEGRALVFHGSAAGLDSVPDWTVDGTDPGGQLGTSVSTAGDVNGDGYDDVIVGAYVHDAGQTDAGCAFVYLGGSTGLAASAAWSAEGDEAGAWFGYSVSTAGDTNGDGYADVLVGAPHKDGGSIVDSGEAYLFLGSASGPAASPAWTGGTSRQDAEYGWSVATAGDADGNGFADFLIGAPQYYLAVGQTEGAMFFFSGSSSGVASSSATFGSQDAARFGHCVATAGDVNGDGFSDVLVGARLHNGTFTNEGKAFLYLGEAGTPSLLADWTTVGNQSSEFYGWSVASAGDVNGDGYSDVAVGAPYFDSGVGDEGRVLVYHGSPGGLVPIPAWTMASSEPSALFGWCVASAGDVDGDGYSDLIAGALKAQGQQGAEGGAMIFRGSSSGLASSPVWDVRGGQAGSDFGVSVASAGDVNGDGYADVVVGAHKFANGESQEGKVSVYLGSPSGPSSTPSWSVESDKVSAYLGSAVAAADVNGDGYSDVIAGAPFFDAGEALEGVVFVFHGSAGGLSLLPDWFAESNEAGARLGTSVDGAGDVNGDGYSDVIAGASGYDGGVTGQGAAFVYLGSSGGLGAGASWSVESGESYAQLGYSVGTAGDVNGDGYSDVIVGTPCHDPGSGAEGLVSVYLGSSVGLSTVAAWTSTNGESGGILGLSVACAGDVNGDGFSDVVSGAPHLNSLVGGAFLFLGNSGAAGIQPSPRQERTDGTGLVALLGRSDAPDGFGVSATSGSPAGRSRVRLEVEVKPAGAAFNGTGTTVTSLADAGLAGVSLSQLVSGLQEDTLYKWRARILDDSPLFPRSRWMSVPGNAATEADLRTGFSSTSAPDAARSAGATLALAPPRPNPSAGAAELRFTLPSAGTARLVVYDLAGRRVAVLADGPRTAGSHSFVWDGTNAAGRRVASGTYFARLSFGERTEIRKIVRVR